MSDRLGWWGLAAAERSEGFSVPAWCGIWIFDLIKRFLPAVTGCSYKLQMKSWALLSISIKLAYELQWQKKSLFLALFIYFHYLFFYVVTGREGRQWIFKKERQMSLGAVSVDGSRWKGRAQLCTAVTDNCQVWEQKKMWFNQKFAACLQRGSEEPLQSRATFKQDYICCCCCFVCYFFFSSWILVFHLSRKAVLGRVCLPALAYPPFPPTLCVGAHVCALCMLAEME